MTARPPLCPASASLWRAPTRLPASSHAGTGEVTHSKHVSSRACANRPLRPSTKTSNLSPRRQYLPDRLLRPLQRGLLRTPEQAARSVLAALALPPAEASGAYVVDGRVRNPDRVIRTRPDVRAALWAVASEQVGLPG